MAIQLTPTSSKYFSEIKNGPLFDQNTGDFGTHLKGSLGERLKAEITVQISWRFDITSYDITNTNTITLSSGSFLSEGFSVGDTANITFRGAGGTSHTFTVVSISSDGKQMVISGAVLTNGSFGVSTYDTLRGLTPLEGLKYNFNFIGNDDTTTFISIIDETTLAYKADGIRTAAPSAVVSTWDDTIIGSQTGNHQVTFDGDISDGGIINEAGAAVFPLNAIQQFTIEHEFKLIPYYLDGELSNVENLLRPERIEAGLSLKHVMEFEFRSTLSNPNTSKVKRIDNVLGQTSYFDENFGDEATQYSVSNVVLSSGLSVDSDNTTNLTFSILSTDSTFLTTHPVVMYHSKLPVSDEYTDSTELFDTNFIFESLRATIDGANANGTIFTDLDIDLVSASQIDVSVDIQFTAAQKLLIDEGDDYLLSFGVANNDLTTDLSDKAIVKVNLSKYIKNNDIAGLMDVTKLEVYTHPMAFTEGVTVGYTGFKGWVQDGIMWDWGFNLDRTLDAVLERFRVRLVALRTSDDTFFSLEDVEYDVAGATVTPGPPTTQQIEINETRGFPLSDDSIFNLKTFTTGTYSAPNQPYTGQTAFKVNWQEWLSLPNADTVFYDPSEPNNGLNQKASQYSLKEGYEIRFIIDADVSVNGASVTNYIFKSPDAVCLDFEEQDGTPITWTSIKETFDTSGANLNQEILTNEDTRVSFTFSPDAAPGLESLYWGIVSIEEVNQPGQAVCQLSTLNYRPSKANNILKPLTGDTEASLTICAGDVCLESLIDYTKLDPAKSYNLYGRLGLIDQTPVVVPTILKDISIDFDNNANFVIFQQSEAMANATLTDSIFQLLDVSGDIVWKSDAANLGGDRSDWAAATTHANFTALAFLLAANSNLYVYCEVNETNYPIILKEGLIINYEAIGAAVSPTNFTLDFTGDSIDYDQVTWFNQKTIVAFVSKSTDITKRHYAIRVAATVGNDYVEYLGSDAVGLAAFNAAVVLLADDVKYGMHCAIERNDTATPTYNAVNVVHSVDFTQVGSDDFEMGQQVGLDTVNDQRDFYINGTSSIAEAITFSIGTPGQLTNKGLDLGTSRSELFNLQNDNTWTMAFWAEMTHFGDSAPGGVFMEVMNTRNNFHGQPTFPQGNGVQYSISKTSVIFRFQSSGSQFMRRSTAYRFAAGHKYHIVATYQPLKSGSTYLASGLQFYVNGVKIVDDVVTNQTITTQPTNALEPVTATQGAAYVKPTVLQAVVDDSGALGAAGISSESVEECFYSMQTFQLWDSLLTQEEIYQTFKDGPDSANLPQTGNLLDDLDMSNPNLGTFTVPNNGSNPDGVLTDNNIGTTWSTIVADGGILNW